MAIGKDLAEKLLKGCRVLWIRSCQHVADKAKSRDKKREKDIFIKISTRIQTLECTVHIVACLESVCGVRSVSQLVKSVPGICSADDAQFVDDNCDWSSVRH